MENVWKTEKVVYGASWRKVFLRYFGELSFSTDTVNSTSLHRLFARNRVTNSRWACCFYNLGQQFPWHSAITLASGSKLPQKSNLMNTANVSERLYGDKKMKRAHVFASILLLTGVSLAQQPANNPQDTTANPTVQPFTRTVVIRSNRGGWGLLGLFGLAGLLGRRRGTIVSGTGYTRDDRTYEQQRRRVA